MMKLVAQTTAKPEPPIKAQSDDCGTVDKICSILPRVAYHDTNTRRNHTSLGHPQLVEPDPCVYILHPRCYGNTNFLFYVFDSGLPFSRSASFYRFSNIV